jgi:hypothetical protein
MNSIRKALGVSVLAVVTGSLTAAPFVAARFDVRANAPIVEHDGARANAPIVEHEGARANAPIVEHEGARADYMIVEHDRA